METESLLEPLLDSWRRNNTILIHLLHLVPEDALALRATETGPTIAQLFTHIHYVRLVFLQEDAPESARPLPDQEWDDEQDRSRIASMLNESAIAVREAFRSKIDSGNAMNLHYDHPVLFLQHMIWHEGYHHGQIKLALKQAGHPIPNQQAGPKTWRVWMNKTPSS
jgi:uncharacterized damage-inducible protein DinB